MIERRKKRKKINKLLPLMNNGWISQEKNNNIMRIFTINPNSFGLDLYEKIEQLKEAYRKYKIDVYLFSSSDRQ